MRFTLRRAAVAAGVVALSLAMGGTALADPEVDHLGDSRAPDGVLPDTDDFVGTGSDTTQYVVTEAAWAFSEQSPAPARRVASFNACLPGSEVPGPVVCGAAAGNIQIRPTVAIPRPNGSSAGINTLINNSNVDFARSSRGSNGSVAEDGLAFLRSLIDPLSYVYDETMPLNSPLRTLDATELNDIYDDCELNVSNGVTLPTPIAVDAKLPQAGSGTRAFFLGAIGHTDNPNRSFGECVDDTVQEHDPNPVNNDANAIAPFSGARFVENPPDPDNPPTDIVDIASTGSTPNTLYVERTVYIVVRDADLADPVKGPLLQSIFGVGGFFCTFYSDQLNRQGFLAHSTCGVADADV